VSEGAARIARAVRAVRRATEAGIAENSAGTAADAVHMARSVGSRTNPEPH
jgi:hypothetical protein